MERRHQFRPIKPDPASKASEDMKVLEEKCRALEERCSEFESSYFDVQMENIRLKDQLEKIRKVYE